MGLGEADKVDLVTEPLPGDTCKAVLFIIDDGSIDDPVIRYEKLIKKLVGYVKYACSPQFQQLYPSVDVRDVLIRILCAKPPTAQMLQIHTISPKGDHERSMQVRFEDHGSFMMRLGRGK